jgi:hypothetical protein
MSRWGASSPQLAVGAATVCQRPTHPSPFLKIFSWSAERDGTRVAQKEIEISLQSQLFYFLI